MTRPPCRGIVVAVGELLDEQERRADVLVQEVVDVLGGEVAEPAVPAARVVGDEDVERAEGVLRSLDDARPARPDRAKSASRNGTPSSRGDRLRSARLASPRLGCRRAPTSRG